MKGQIYKHKNIEVYSSHHLTQALHHVGSTLVGGAAHAVYEVLYQVFWGGEHSS
jgi:hypothetical protein